MIGVLGRVPSGQRKIAWAEPCQDLDCHPAPYVGVRHPSESGWQERCCWGADFSWHIGFARRPHSVTSTECGRREPEVRLAASTPAPESIADVATSRQRTEMNHL